MAAHANEIAAFKAGFSRNIRDLDECRARCEELVALGATGLIAIYPPHVDVRLSIFTPSADEVDKAARRRRGDGRRSRGRASRGPARRRAHAARRRPDQGTSRARPRRRGGPIVTGEPVVETVVDPAVETAIEFVDERLVVDAATSPGSAAQLPRHELHQLRPHRVPGGRRPVPGLRSCDAGASAGAGRRAARIHGGAASATRSGRSSALHGRRRRVRRRRLRDGAVRAAHAGRPARRR